MKQINKISLSELRQMALNMYDNLIKADVDVRQMLIVVDAELHSDIEQFMLDNGSMQEDLWGINIYPAKYGTPDFIEFDSMINIRPRQGNRSRYVEDSSIRDKIINIINEAVIDD